MLTHVILASGARETHLRPTRIYVASGRRRAARRECIPYNALGYARLLNSFLTCWTPSVGILFGHLTKKGPQTHLRTLPRAKVTQSDSGAIPPPKGPSVFIGPELKANEN